MKQRWFLRVMPTTAVCFNITLTENKGPTRSCCPTTNKNQGGPVVPPLRPSPTPISRLVLEVTLCWDQEHAPCGQLLFRGSPRASCFMPDLGPPGEAAVTEAANLRTAKRLFQTLRLLLFI